MTPLHCLVPYMSEFYSDTAWLSCLYSLLDEKSEFKNASNLAKDDEIFTV